jgi:hypothetical protein
MLKLLQYNDLDLQFLNLVVIELNQLLQHLVLEFLIDQIDYLCVLLLKQFLLNLIKFQEYLLEHQELLKIHDVTPAILTAEIATPPKSPKSTRLN